MISGHVGGSRRLRGVRASTKAEGGRCPSTDVASQRSAGQANARVEYRSGASQRSVSAGPEQFQNMTPRNRALEPYGIESHLRW